MAVRLLSNEYVCWAALGVLSVLVNMPKRGADSLAEPKVLVIRARWKTNVVRYLFRTRMKASKFILGLSN